MTIAAVQSLEASSSASKGAISYIELAQLSAATVFYRGLALVMCKVASRVATKTLKAIKTVPHDEIIDPSGELIEALQSIERNTYRLYTSRKENNRKGFLGSCLDKELVALNHLQSETIVWINEHNADATGLSEDGPHESVDDFIKSLA
ncbi:hypothetical protein [Neptuniibacter sp.]|uniref:hypothetical protein n=1 Tax=Neptuniibacter sp. TaxID=1962643 RepID=UPI0026274FCF|nr:hypothetical protein [Neptuniibacter sp.]MCP4596169.1 hypothetical protein [Neptuniibacter sp.]